MVDSSENQVSLYLLLYGLVVFFTVFLFGMMVATSYQNSQPTIEFDDRVYINSSCSSDGIPIEDVRLSLDQKDNTDRKFEQSLEYTFFINESVDNYTADSGIGNDADVVRNKNNSSITVRVNGSTSRPYGYLSNSSLHPFSPSVNLIYEEEASLDLNLSNSSYNPLVVGIEENYTKQRVYSFEDYRDCITGFDSDKGDTVAFVNQNNIIFSEMTKQPKVYKIYSEDSDRTTYIIGEYNERQIAHTNNVIRTGGSYNGTFNKSNEIRVYSANGISPAGLIINRFGEQPTVYLENKYIGRDSIVVGHEWAHSYQNFRTSTKARWWTEGSAEYVGALIESDAGMNEEKARNMAFSYGWNDNTESNITMSDPDSWEDNVQYKRGPRIVYLVDVAIRHHNDDKTILDLMERMNEERYITHEETIRIISEMTTEGFSDRYDRLVKQSEPVNIREELEGMESQREVERLPRTFSDTDYNIVECTYEGDVAVVEQCEEESE